MRSSTSIGANYKEAHGTGSRAIDILEAVDLVYDNEDTIELMLGFRNFLKSGDAV